MRKAPLVLFAVLAIACKGTSKPSPETPGKDGVVDTLAEEHWDFYPAKINDAPASVMVNFTVAEHAPVKGHGQLLWVFIEMVHPGNHGMGLAAETEATGPIEDGLAARVRTELGAFYVGRIRGERSWQLYFYGRDARGFEDVVGAFMKDFPARKYSAGDKLDPDWKVYREVIYPEPERLAWIGDNSVVEQLRKGGDPLTEPRRVDHWIYFERADQRDAFEADAKALGFSTEHGAEGADEDGKLGLQVHRVDHVDVDRIHAVVMELTELAAKHGGEYDGWETEILKPTAAPPPAAEAPTDREPG